MGIPVNESEKTSIESLAYEVVRDVETIDANDRNRLGYHVYLFMKNEFDSLEEAVRVAQARLTQPADEILARLATRLRELGYQV